MVSRSADRERKINSSGTDSKLKVNRPTTNKSHIAAKRRWSHRQDHYDGEESPNGTEVLKCNQRILDGGGLVPVNQEMGRNHKGLEAAGQ